MRPYKLKKSSLMSRIERRYCLISTSYLAGLFDIFILLLIFFQEGTITNPALLFVLSAVRIFLSLTTVTVTARKSAGEGSHKLTKVLFASFPTKSIKIVIVLCAHINSWNLAGLFEMFLLLHIWQNCVCFEDFYQWEHFVMLIIRNFNLISVQSWTCLEIV